VILYLSIKKKKFLTHLRRQSLLVVTQLIAGPQRAHIKTRKSAPARDYFVLSYLIVKTHVAKGALQHFILYCQNKL
jgi:hypothetical protein